VTPDGKHVYVTNESTPTGTVAVIKAATNKVVATIPVGEEPTGVAFTPDGKRAYVTNFNSNDVSVVDTSTKKVVATIGVGTHPSGVGIVMARRAASRPVPRHK
jgi:YVTN family beta-propeller protein